MPQKDTLYGDLFVVGNFEANLIKKTGGTSSEFLKADGSVDSTAYLTTTPTLAQVTTAGNTTTNAITVGKLSIVNTSTTVSPLIISGTNPSVSGIGTDYFVINGTGNVGVTLKTDTGGYVAHRFFANGSELGVFYAGETNKEFVFKNSTTGYIDFQTTSSATSRVRIFNNGNVGINTTTDAGYKLDVNGTARVSGNTVIDGSLLAGTTASDTTLRYRFSTSVNFTVSGSSGGVYLGLGTGTSGYTGNNFSLARAYINEYGATVNAFMSTDSNPYTFRFGAYGSSSESLRLTNTQVTAYQKFVTSGSITAASALAQGVYFNNTLVAAANNDVLVGLDINPTFTNGAFTGVSNYAARIQGNTLLGTGAFTYGNTNSTGGKLTIVNTSGYNGLVISNGVGTYQLTINTTHSDSFGVKFSWNDGINNPFLQHANNIGTVLGTTIQTVTLKGNTTILGYAVSYGTYAEGMRVAVTTGNVLINTTTDAGFKLDVNGTARVSGNTSISAGNLSIFTTNTPRRINVQSGAGGQCSILGMYDGGGSLQAAFGIETVSTNALQMASTSAIRFYAGSVIGNAATEPTNERMRLFSNGNLAIGTTTDAGQRLQVSGNVFIKGTTSLTATKVFEVQNGAGASIMDFRDNQYAFFGCGQGGGSNSGFIFNYSNTSYTQFSGYNYGAGAGSYKPILMDTDGGGRNQGIFVNFGVTTNTPPNSDTEFGVLGRTSDSTTYISRFRNSGNTDKFAIRADGALFTNTLQGYSGTLNIPTNPPGTSNITITNGLITNIA